jgi:hypothetical protein
VFNLQEALWHPSLDMDSACPLCRSTIAIGDINVATDIAPVAAVARPFRFRNLSAVRQASLLVWAAPPNGAWFEQLADGFRTHATTRSWTALLLVPFTCVWSGISLGGIYGKQMSSGQFDPTSSLFGVPFLLGSVFVVGYGAMMTTELSQRGGSLLVM